MAFFFGKKIRDMQSIITDGNLKKTNSCYPFGTPIIEPLPMATSEVDMKFLSAFAVRLDPFRLSELQLLNQVSRSYPPSF
jgi:hypothetical protein